MRRIETPITVRTPSRLHFGLLGWGPRSSRQFGGVGLMVDDPGLELVVRRAEEWSASGPLAPRALEIARSLSERLADEGRPVGPVQVQLRPPPEHAGLGVGTQLSLALALALTHLAGEGPPPTARLAGLTGRGLRSGIGLHGFERGGLIVDGGRRPDSAIPPLLARHPFPRDWSVLVVVPESGQGLHGPGEEQAFRRLARVPAATTDRLCRLVLLGLLPAVIEHDLTAFGEALEDIQSHVGSVFAPVQGGSYAHPQVETLAAALRDAGLFGVGQSSWGPTLYGFTDAPDDARPQLLGVIRSLCDRHHATAFWTRANNEGARLIAVEENRAPDNAKGLG